MGANLTQIEVEFKIHGPNHLYGDGFAMWLTKQRATPGPVFGSTDKFEGLGIFFDTYKNNRPGVSFPYIMAMMGDGQTAYDQEHDGKANELAGCSVSSVLLFLESNRRLIGCLRLAEFVTHRCPPRLA
jgi:Legume-like lectin family